MAGGPTVAIMQPYFAPYAGYFRLMATTDIFVIYDCVQFPRRGWVHRNQLPDAAGDLQWLTLPLAKAPQEAKIRELAFRPDAAAAMVEAMQRFPLLNSRRPDPFGLIDLVRDVSVPPLDYIERLLARAAGAMDLPWNVLRSSSLSVPPEVTGQDRIIAIAQALGAARYVNAPGGRALYDAPRFEAVGLELRFLPEYQGSYASILARLLQEPVEAVAAELRASSMLTS
jgi:hypothetical protein